MNRSPLLSSFDRQKFADLLRSCSKKSLLDHGKEAHTCILKLGFGEDVMINTDLISMYGKYNKIDLARKVFDQMPERNVVSWTSLMCCYSRMGDYKTSLSLFNQMGFFKERPNEFTFSTNFKSVGHLGSAKIGMQIQGLVIKTGYDVFVEVGNSIIDMYVKCGLIKEGEKMFDCLLPVRNVISWNVMIAGYTYVGSSEKTLILFRKMQEQGDVPDEFTSTSTLKACSDRGLMREGMQIHASLITKGFFLYPDSVQIIICGALIDLYVNCRNLLEARKVFDFLSHKNVISWTTLILGYAQEQELAEAMELFKKLRESDIKVDGFVLSSIIGMFADLALIEQGKQLHCYSVKTPCGLDISVSNSTLDMYLKCGLMEEGERYFDEMLERNVVSWTVMLTGYGKHGNGTDAVRLFNKMELDSVEPDGVTYLALLSACSHSGLVEEGKKYFARLCSDRRIKPKVVHYACMVDLFGRLGRLKEAKDLIQDMPMKPNVGIWQTLFSACRVHGDLEMGKEVGEIVLHMDSEDPVNYVMMSNIYADAGFWRESQKVREEVKRKGLKKNEGQSWVEIDKQVHYFYGGDDRHPLTDKIHEILIRMEKKMKEEVGFAYGVRSALHDVEEESREENLRVHSEKLAIGLALVHDDGLNERQKVIRVFKNLRVCVDCHEFIKGLSKVLKKVFVVRDANRFHKFENGLCSCGDYW